MVAMKKILLLTMVLAATLSLMAQDSLYEKLLPSIEQTPYATEVFVTRDSALYLDIYLPETQNKQHACLLYVHSGGFIGGERTESISHIGPYLLKEGFVIISIDYRLGLKGKKDLGVISGMRNFQNAIDMAAEDLLAATSYILQNKLTVGHCTINPNYIITCGSSAGAITVLQTDWCRANSLPLVASLPQGFRPAAVIPYAGGVNCRNGKMHYATPPAPTCFFHGTVDRIVAYKRFRGSVHGALNGAATVVKEFKKKGYSYWILRYEDRGHEVAGALPSTVDEFCAFVDATLRGHHMAYDATCVNSEIRQSRWTHMSLFELYNLIKN
jgi:hypothetical protein